MMSIFDEGALAVSRVGVQESTEAREQEPVPQVHMERAGLDEAVVRGVQFAAEVYRTRLSPRDEVDSSNPFEREAQRVRHLQQLVRTGQASPDELTDYLEMGVDDMGALAKKLGAMQRELSDRLAPGGPQATEEDPMDVARSVAGELFETQDGLADAHGKQLSANALSLLDGTKGQ